MFVKATKFIEEHLPLFYDLMEFYPDFERELLFGCIDGYLKDDCRNYLHGFLDGLHYSDRMSDDYYMSCIAELQRLEEGVVK